MNEVEVAVVSNGIDTELNMERVRDLNYSLVLYLKPFLQIKGYHFQLILNVSHNDFSGSVEEDLVRVLREREYADGVKV